MSTKYFKDYINAAEDYQNFPKAISRPESPQKTLLKVMPASESPSPGGVEARDGITDAHVVQLRLLFTAWISYFRSLGYIKESTMDMLDRTVCKKSIELSVKDPKAREAIGTSEKVWSDLVDLFRVANPSLEQRSYGPLDPVTAGYDGPSSNVIVTNSLTLLKDLTRLDSILSMARNVLTTGEKVQNLAAQVGFDREVCAMINLCIKITARGYDGDGTSVEEDRWQGVINGFKKLLITSLQFLSNLVTLNERLKLMLWVELFDSSTDPIGDGAVTAARSTDSWVMNATNAFMNQAKNPPIEATPDRPPTSKPLRPTTAYFIFLADNREKIRSQLSLRTEPSNKDIVREATRRWNAMSDKERMIWKTVYSDRLATYRKNMEAWEAAGCPDGARDPDEVRHDFAAVVGGTGGLSLEERADEQPLDSQSDTTVPISSFSSPQDVSKPYSANADLFAPPTFTEPDYRMMESAADGARKLAEGKAQLLKRLENLPLERNQPPAVVSPTSPIPSPTSPIDDMQQEEEPPELIDEEESEEEESSDDEDYAIPGEDGRGLLTDVPLILGPNEIEVLPMIVMSGIVPPPPNSNQPKQDGQETPATMINMYTIRCHLLLAQENGRNLLRELLIFVAAWDLREEELYFKFMVKIMEAILMNGLMPFAYGAFKEDKDIISPAQAVIMKLLTKIFHARQGFATCPNNLTATSPSGLLSIAEASSHLPPSFRFDIQIVHCLFSEFRQHIIPQICALIFLQGQIRFGHANLEDFPLNLWDMERMYEGVYQYLEFFAILTDHDVWKQMMADWEVASELVTLLRELEVAIPKGRLTAKVRSPANNAPAQSLAPPTGTGAQTAAPQTTPSEHQPPSAVERPYDVNGSLPQNADPPTALPTTITPTPTTLDGPYPSTTSTPPIHDEPAEFEWRNLKKLCVLVLSSLVWKNRPLQDQVRSFGGITAILSCCNYDEHNPYIREHAIMCLRFLLEGNAEAQEVVRGLQRRQQGGGKEAAAAAAEEEEDGLGKVTVPQEVLDQHGYETFMDAKGQVGLRRKEAPLKGGGSSSSSSSSSAAAAARDVKAMVEQGGSLPEWMQLVMKSMPRER